MIDPTQLWGKKAVTNNRQLWLPLRAHLEETRKMMVFLYDRYLNDAQRKLLNAGFEGEDEVIRTLILSSSKARQSLPTAITAAWMT